ncbi:hypothetical protein [Clostridium manihotivorum]|uniref:Peptidase MA-like domain-containing protein n=1 Tax=Clostridium manihotivorum TaxID=2320868 RepID=A0A410DSR4_9CLOT|nr:hypothetical protein [Clostridium manihotivorum]QAA32303.1 hypothetical protein C1I91_12020 [Clostridium manihotivorum]
MTRELEDYSDNVDLKNITAVKDYKLNLRRETQHFIIDYTEFDQPCIDKVSDVLENNYARITTNFKQQLEEKLIIELHPDHKQLHVALGFPDAPDWVRGGLGVGKIAIASPLNPPPGSEFHNVLNTAVHEFVHIIVNRINENTPRWLNEGIAGYEAKDNNENWIIQTVKSGLLNNTVPTFSELDTGDDFETFFNRDGYQYSYTIVEAIVKLFDYEKLCNFIKSPNSFVDSFGLTEAELQNKWIDYIRKNYC